MEGTARHRLFSARSALALGVLAVTLNIAALVVVASAGESEGQLIRTISLLPAVTVGTLVAVRRPGNPLGWLLLGAGLFFSVNAGAVAYSILDYRFHHGTLPLGRVALALEPTWAGGLVMIAGCLWLFPEGRLPSGRWRRVGGILFGAGLAYGALMLVPWMIAAAASSLRVETDGTPTVIEHPAGAQLLWLAIENVGFFALLISFVVWLAVQVPKYRRSGGELRLQLKWLYSGAFVFVVCLMVYILEPTYPSADWRFVSAAVAPGIAALPIAVGIGILKFRLYEIDRIISRTLSYTLVTGLVIGVYIGVVTLATRVRPFSSEVAVAGSTLVAAALFNPLRRRVQHRVDRRFNRARYDADLTVAAFAGRLQDATDPDAVRADLTGTVQRALEPASMSLWLSGPGQ
jgi:hypothetical protein